MNDTEFNSGSSDVADLLAVHLQDEEAVLSAALPSARALKAAFTHTSSDMLPQMAEQHRAIAELLGDIKVRRQRFREMLARRCRCDAESITVSQAINGLPGSHRESLEVCAGRLRQMAAEFVEIYRWLGVHLRIHLDAYQRLLYDLTGTANHSGRYGAEGRAETGDFRPLIQIQG